MGLFCKCKKDSSSSNSEDIRRDYNCSLNKIEELIYNTLSQYILYKTEVVKTFMIHMYNGKKFKYTVTYHNGWITKGYNVEYLLGTASYIMAPTHLIVDDGIILRVKDIEYIKKIKEEKQHIELSDKEKLDIFNKLKFSK